MAKTLEEMSEVGHTYIHYIHDTTLHFISLHSIHVYIVILHSDFHHYPNMDMSSPTFLDIFFVHFYLAFFCCLVNMEI